MVEDQTGDDIRAEQAEAGARAVEIDIGQGDGVAGERMEVGRSIGQLVELAEEGTEAALGLGEGIRVQLVAARPPPAGGVPADLAGLRLDDEEAAVRMGDHEVGLAVGQLAAVTRAPGPGDVREDAVAVGRWQGGPNPRLHELLCGLPGGQRGNRIPPPGRRPRAAATLPNSVAVQSIPG